MQEVISRGRVQRTEDRPLGGVSSSVPAHFKLNFRTVRMSCGICDISFSERLRCTLPCRHELCRTCLDIFIGLEVCPLCTVCVQCDEAIDITREERWQYPNGDTLHDRCLSPYTEERHIPVGYSLPSDTEEDDPNYLPKQFTPRLIWAPVCEKVSDSEVDDHAICLDNWSTTDEEVDVCEGNSLWVNLAGE